MRRAAAVALLLVMAALSVIGLVAPPPAVLALVVLAVLFLKTRRTAFLWFAASTAVFNVVVFLLFIPSGPTAELGPFTLGLGGAERGLVGAGRIVAVTGVNLAILSRAGPERMLDGLGLPAAATTFLGAVIILAHDLGRDFERLISARRLEATWPRRLAGRAREAARLVPPLLVSAFRRAETRREALRLAGHDTPPVFAPLVAVTALAVGGRLLLLGLPNIALTYVVVFLGGLLFGWRVGFWGGILSMVLTDLMLTGFLPAPFANAPAMALVGLLGAAMRSIDFSGGAVERWTGRLFAFTTGVVGTLLFSIVSDVLTWLIVPEFRTAPGYLRVLVLAGLLFNVVPSLVNGFLFAASAGPVSRAFRELRRSAPPPLAPAPLATTRG